MRNRSAGKATIEVTADASGVTQGVNKAKASVTRGVNEMAKDFAELPRASSRASREVKQNMKALEAAVVETERKIHGGHAPTQLTAIRATTRTLTGKVSITTAERFLESIGAGQISQKIFPVLGAAALLPLLGEFSGRASEIKEQIDQLRNAPKAIADGFRSINLAAETTNDELDAQNAKLDAEIAKLQGKPANGLEQAIADVRVETDKLTKSLDAANGAVTDLLKKNTDQSLLGTLFDKQHVDDLKKQQMDYARQISAIFDNAREVNRGMSASGAGHLLGIHFVGKPAATFESATKQALALNKKSTEALLAQRRDALHNAGGLSMLGLPERLAVINGMIDARIQERRQLQERLENLRKTEQVSALKAHPRSTAAQAAVPRFRLTAQQRERVRALNEQVRSTDALYKRMHADELQYEQDQRRRQAATAETLSQVKAHTAALKNLTAAMGEGIQAQRDAQIQNLISEGKANGQSADVIAARVKEMKAQFALRDAQNRPPAWLTGGAKAGARQYFEEMRANVRTAAEDVHDILGGAFYDLGATMTGVIQGQRGAWSQFFSQLSAQFASIGLNKLFGAFGGFALGKLGAGLTAGDFANMGGGPSAADLLQLASVPAFASGGYSPGGFRVVGEHGPELEYGGPANIMSNRDLRSALGSRGGGNVYYSIDARGANEAAVDMRVRRALVAVHGSAVRNAVAVQQEIRARSPRSKFRP